NPDTAGRLSSIHSAVVYGMFPFPRQKVAPKTKNPPAGSLPRWVQIRLECTEILRHEPPLTGTRSPTTTQATNLFRVIPILVSRHPYHYTDRRVAKATVSRINF